ncbi:MAG: hypothetical protein AB7N91_07620 [Candidatus Tectimicrobiota bacterium]
MATTIPHRIPTLQHAIADLTGYEDADTLRWQQACVHAAQQLTAEQGRYAGTASDRLAQGLDLAQRGGVTLAEDLDDFRAEVTSGNAHYTVDLAQLGCSCLDCQQRNAPCMHLLAAEIHTGALGLFTAAGPLIPLDTAPPATNTSLQEEPGATASGPTRARRTRTVRTPRGQAPVPTGSPASWPTSEAPASMNVKLKVGNMELMYTARDTNDRDLQDRMTRLLPWLAEVMAACEANYEARQQATERRHQQTEEERQAQARSLDEQIAAAVQAAMQAQASGHNGHSPQQGNAAPPQPPDAERLASAPDHEPSWCPTHQVTMRWHEGNARGPGWFSHQLTDGRYCKGK